MRPSVRIARKLAAARVAAILPMLVAVLVAVLAAVFADGGLAGSPTTETLRGVDTRLCPFAFEVKVTRKLELGGIGAARVKDYGPTTVTLRNRATGRTVDIEAAGSSSLKPATGNMTFSGHQLWLGPRNHVPYLATTGRGAKKAPTFALSGADGHPRVVDPCALLAAAPPSTQPVTATAPWRLPVYALSQIAYAGLTPLIGAAIRHDHVHLDLILDGRKVTIPAGVGQAEPVDVGPGPCPPPPESRSIGDCASGHYFTARVAASPLQTHTSSGIVHIQSDRPGAVFRLGQFFDEWGVRFDSSCIGGHCAGGGKELRVYVDGRRALGDPRKIVLRSGEEIAVVLGAPGDFGDVPSRYALRWPGGCGGVGERSCFPSENT